ncbi:MAG: SDR family oxidoreductase [Anaerolineae bacterium]|nr:SDR family oxidoreductase [Anaerolineae bacterium]
MSGLLEGQVAVITGAAHGMGEAIAKTFAREGAALGLLDRDAEALAAAVDELQNRGAMVLGQEVDVRDFAAIQGAVAAFENALGPIDILVNSAGLGIYKPFPELTEEDWDLTFDVNVKGTFLMCKAVVPGMLQRGKGLIINIASLAALLLGFDRGSCYAASKYAVRGFTNYLFRELRSKGIKVCCLNPGTTDSHFRGRPTGNPNWMVPQDVANVALFVATQRERVNVAEIAFSMINEAW